MELSLLMMPFLIKLVALIQHRQKQGNIPQIKIIKVDTFNGCSNGL
jgi:hypothetical protein